MNAKMSVFVICVEPIIYLSLYNLHDCTFKEKELLHIFLQHDFVSKSYETKKLVDVKLSSGKTVVLLKLKNSVRLFLK